MTGHTCGVLVMRKTAVVKESLRYSLYSNGFITRSMPTRVAISRGATAPLRDYVARAEGTPTLSCVLAHTHTHTHSIGYVTLVLPDF